MTGTQGAPWRGLARAGVAVFVGVTAVLGAGAGGALSAQTLTGIVLDNRIDRGIGGATLIVVDSAGEHRARMVSDALGRFRFHGLAPGEYALLAQHEGYAEKAPQKFHIAPDESVELVVRMDPAVIPLRPIEVTVRSVRDTRLGEFYERSDRSRQLGRGDIFMREDIEARQPSRISQLLGTLPRLRGCHPTVYLDGIQVRGARGLQAADEVAHPIHVEGIEVYYGISEAPVEYLEYGSCAVVLVWTRRGTDGGEPLTSARLLAAGLVVAGLLLLMQTF